MLRIASEEWLEWGGLVQPAWQPAPPPLPAETQAKNFPRLVAYWRAVDPEWPEVHAAIARNRARFRTGDVSLFAEPAWSAAFVSYVMRAAGVDAREFPPRATHALYIDALLTDAQIFPATAPFLPQDPAQYPPAPGDLVCFDRAAHPLRHWTERLAEPGRIRPMHCDIVLSTPPLAVEAVGGNVVDAVTLTRYPADGAGRLLPAPEGRPPLVLVLQNRLGLLPPWSPPGNVAPSTVRFGSPAS
jgi:hypothetical protein